VGRTTQEEIDAFVEANKDKPVVIIDQKLVALEPHQWCRL
jgi:hypothetical protein